MAAAFIQACNNKLDVTPYDSLPKDEAIADIPGAKSALVGAYDGLQVVGYYGRNYWVMTELNADNVYLSTNNSNRFKSSFVHDYITQDGDVEDFWVAGYNTILRADNIINAIDNINGDQSDKDKIKGEALFIRALAHFDLVQMFANPYKPGNGAQAGIPIKLKFGIEHPKRNTVKEVYDRVITDLTQVKDLLKNTDESSKFRASKYAASALLARVYLSKGDYANAIAEATTVIGAGYSLQPVQPDYYNVLGGQEEIFTLQFVAAKSLNSDNFGQMYLKPGYGDIRVSPDLLAVLSANDTRRKNYIAPFAAGSPESVNRKFTGQDGMAGLHSPKILRLAEMYLIRAEAYAKTNQFAQAIADLNTLRAQRGLATLTAIPNDEVLGNVLDESRREFMFEGHRYFDLMRNGLPVNRTFCGNVLEIPAPCTIKPGDGNAILPIPQLEINTNSNMEQNEGYK